MELLRKQAEADKKQYEDLVRERDILSKVLCILRGYEWCISVYGLSQDLRKSEGAHDRLQHLVKIREQTIKTLQHEIGVCASVCTCTCTSYSMYYGIELQRRSKETAKLAESARKRA